MPRYKLNTGQPAVPGSGDTIHDGGNKLRDNNTEIYHAFGDQRLSGIIKEGSEEWIRIHATGYYQHKNLSFFSSAIESGTMYDIESTLSSGSFPVTLPVIGKIAGNARRGERVAFQDTIGSWGTVPVVVSANTGQSITGSVDGKYSLNTDRTRAFFVVVNDDPGTERWAVQTESITNTNAISIDRSVELVDGQASRIDLYERSSYNAVKVLIYAESFTTPTPDTEVVAKRSTFEMSIMQTMTDVYSTSYAVMNINDNNDPQDLIVQVTPVMYTNANGKVMVALDITTSEPATQTVRVSVQSSGSVKQTI